MRTQKRSQLALLMWGSLLTWCCMACGQTTSTPAKVGISVEKALLTQHEPVILNLSVSNSSSAEIDFDPGFDNERIEAKVVDPEGHVWVKPRVVSHEGTKFSNAVHVDPGYTRVVSVLLNDWFAFNKTGEYQIEITLLPPNKAIGEEASDRIGERLVLTILPRGEATLASGCSALLTQAKDSQSYATALVAAKALSVVDDPVAVQFMAEAVKRREFASLMIAALARLNTDEAVNALRSASRSSDNETSSLARAALSALGKSERQVRIDVP